MPKPLTLTHLSTPCLVFISTCFLFSIPVSSQTTFIPSLLKSPCAHTVHPYIIINTVQASLSFVYLRHPCPFPDTFHILPSQVFACSTRSLLHSCQHLFYIFFSFLISAPSQTLYISSFLKSSCAQISHCHTITLPSASYPHNSSLIRDTDR